MLESVPRVFVVQFYTHIMTRLVNVHATLIHPIVVTSGWEENKTRLLTEEDKKVVELESLIRSIYKMIGLVNLSAEEVKDRVDVVNERIEKEDKNNSSSSCCAAVGRLTAGRLRGFISRIVINDGAS